MSCASPIDAAVLADYWLGALQGSEEEAVEEHLLECDGCGARLRELIALAEGVRKLARGGTLRMVVSEAFLERAACNAPSPPKTTSSLGAWLPT
jgi:anti-sigma factor RsiW